MVRYLQEETVYWNSSLYINFNCTEERIADDGKPYYVNFWRNLLKEIQADVFSDKARISYFIDSELTPEDIMSTSPDIPLLIQGILGVSVSGYESRLYRIEGDTKYLVSINRRKSEKQKALRMMNTPEDCIRLIQLIVAAQAEYKSWLAHALVTSLSQYWPSGHINNAFAWTWWGFEWLVQSLEKKNPAKKRLDYLVNDSSGNTPNLREQFKDDIKDKVDYYLSLKPLPIDEKITLEQMELELDYTRKRANDELLALTFIEKLENKIPFLQSVVDTFIGDFSRYGGTKDTLSLLEGIFHDIKPMIHDLIKPAYEARGSGFHTGDYRGLLSPPTYDRIDAIRQLNRFVRPLVAMVLTRHPPEYDTEERTESRNVSLVYHSVQKLTEESFDVCSKGFLEWNSWNDGTVVKEQVPISGIAMDKDMNFSFNPVIFPNPDTPPGSSVLSPLKAYDGRYTLRAGSVTARGNVLPGTISAERFETYYLEIHRKSDMAEDMV